MWTGLLQALLNKGLEYDSEYFLRSSIVEIFKSKGVIKWVGIEYFYYPAGNGYERQNGHEIEDDSKWFVKASI